MTVTLPITINRVLHHPLTVIEALLGSIFLVTLVARLVTLWVRQDEAHHRGEA